MFDIVTNLISERKIPAPDELHMEALLRHLFTATSRDIRKQVAEVAYRYHHPRAMDVFLASALPLAMPTARRRAARIFVHPSDLQIELMYGGAVEAVIAVFRERYLKRILCGGARDALQIALTLFMTLCLVHRSSTANRLSGRMSPASISWQFCLSSIKRKASVHQSSSRDFIS